MKVLLDENIPKRLRADISRHDVFHVSDVGWSALDDAAIVDQAERDYDAVITADSSLRYQQNWTGRRLILLVLRAPNNRLPTLRSLMPKLCAALDSALPGTIEEIR